LLYVGEIREHKGVWHLLEAMKLLTERGVDVELRLLGRGPLLEPGKQYAEQHGFADRCCFEGYVSHGPALFRFFQENDLFVFPSFSEGSPKVVLEALAFATPVVTTPVGAVSLVVQDGVQGVHTPIGDSAAVADAVAGILADANRYHQMSRACIDMAHRWTRSAVTERLIQQLTDTGLYTAPPALSEGSTNA
jgi:glycosyltransferase involved in cell wall biosynthesis